MPEGAKMKVVGISLLAGLVCICVAAFLVSTAAGFAAAGVSFLTVARLTARAS
jgi:hypothetical protein